MKEPEDWSVEEIQAFFAKTLAKPEVTDKELSIGLRLLHKQIIEAEELLRRLAASCWSKLILAPTKAIQTLRPSRAD